MLWAATVSLPGSLGGVLQASDLRSQGEYTSVMWMGGMHAWPAAYNAGWISLRSPPAPRNSLPEYKCIPASLQKTATINATDQPVTGLPLNCTQRQNWIDFVFYLKVNQIAVHFSRKSSPYQTLNTPQKNPNKPQYFVSAAMPKMIIKSENKRSEDWWLPRMSSQIRSPASVPRKAGDNTIGHLWSGTRDRFKQMWRFKRC